MVDASSLLESFGRRWFAGCGQTEMMRSGIGASNIVLGRGRLRAIIPPGDSSEAEVIKEMNPLGTDSYQFSLADGVGGNGCGRPLS